MLGKVKRHKISREEKRAILAEFTQLPESYVIFIVKKDILNLQKQIYYVDRRIRDSEEYFSEG